MKRSPIEAIALLAQPLTETFSENVRYFIPAELIPVAPGSARARKVGLKKYRGANRGPGFAIQSSQLLTTLLEIFAALDHNFPGVPPMQSDPMDHCLFRWSYRLNNMITLLRYANNLSHR